MAAIFALAAFGAQSASALTPTSCPLAGSDFQAGDGNQLDQSPLACPPTLPLTKWRDWKNVTATAAENPDPNATDSTFGTGSKETDPSGWDLIDPGSNPVTPGKDNILAAFSQPGDALSPSIDKFLYLAFHRASTSSADTFMDFELNKFKTTWWNGTDVIPCRTDGDLVISYEIHPNNAQPVTVNLYEWMGSGGPTVPNPLHAGTSACPDGATGDNATETDAYGHTRTFTDGLALISTTGLAQGAMNFAGNTLTAADQPAGGSAGDIKNYLDTANNGTSFDAGTFGEAGLNLSQTIGAGSDPCFSFGAIQMHSRSSEQISSNLNDYISPVPIAINSCTISGHKFEDLNGNGNNDNGTDPPLQGWTFYADYNNNGVKDAGEPSAVTGANGDYTITGVKASTAANGAINDNGTYKWKVRETLQSGWTCSAPSTTDAHGCFTLVAVAAGGTFTATSFGNWEQPKLTVEKSLSPSNDPGLFDLKIGNSVVAQDATDGTSSGAQNESPGNYTVSEAPGSNTPDLTNYQKSIECKDGGGAGSVVATTSGADHSSQQVTLQSGDDVVCTITNVRETGHLTVDKALTPNTDPGLFDLKVGSTVVKADATDGGSSGQLTENTGSYTISEAPGSNTPDLTNYQKSISCVDHANNDTVVASIGADNATLASVPVTYQSDIRCTVTNVREQGQITVTKALSPANDSGLFDLKVGSTVVKADATNGGSGSESVNTGSYTVSEAPGSNSPDLTNYQKSISCVDHANNDTVVASIGADNASLASVPVTYQSDIRCTVTNVRQTTIHIKKVNSGGAAGDSFSFTPSAQLAGTGAAIPALGAGGKFSLTGGGSQAFTGVLPDTTGAYTVTESNAPGYVLASIGCDDADSTTSGSTATIRTSPGEDVTCTFTNRALRPALAIDKTGPATATAGDLVPYTLIVTDPGETSFADGNVSVTDPQCTTPVSLQTKNRGAGVDTSPGTLDPGDSWVYSCSVQTHAGDQRVDNQGCVSGTDVFGRSASACDPATTTLVQPQQQVLGERIPPGDAHIAGATGCVPRTFKVTISGKQIQKVVFKVDGKKRASLIRPNSGSRFVLSIDPKKFKPGSHLVVASTTFTAASQTKAKTLKLRFSRCVKRKAPAFTG